MIILSSNCWPRALAGRRKVRAAMCSPARRIARRQAKIGLWVFLAVVGCVFSLIVGLLMRMALDGLAAAPQAARAVGEHGRAVPAALGCSGQRSPRGAGHGADA